MASCATTCRIQRVFGHLYLLKGDQCAALCVCELIASLWDFDRRGQIWPRLCLTHLLQTVQTPFTTGLFSSKNIFGTVWTFLLGYIG